jgi:hypothetical protein
MAGREAKGAQRLRNEAETQGGKSPIAGFLSG